MNYGKATLLIFLLFIIIFTCAARARRDAEPYCDSKGAKKVEVAPADLDILGLTVARSTFKDVQTKLGPAKPSRVSRDEESDVSICYVSPSDGTVLVFYTGVMGGGQDITWFGIWAREAKFPHSSDCSPSRRVSRALKTASGLQLGLTRADLQKIAGTPTQLKPELDEYDFVCRRKMTEDEVSGFKTSNGWDVTKDPYFDRMSWIRAWYADSKASRIEIGEIESY
jgi:hypothetical protein